MLTCQTLFPGDCLWENQRWSLKVQRPAAARCSPSLPDSPYENISLLLQQTTVLLTVELYFSSKITVHFRDVSSLDESAVGGLTSVVAGHHSVRVTGLLHFMTAPVSRRVVFSLVSISLLPLLQPTTYTHCRDPGLIWKKHAGFLPA